jgi:predicted oxidoreductase (fatty acid repression mutant protein)
LLRDAPAVRPDPGPFNRQQPFVDVLFSDITESGEVLNLTNEEIVKYMFGNDVEPTDEYIEGFIEGAQEFFAEVRNQL